MSDAERADLGERVAALEVQVRHLVEQDQAMRTALAGLTSAIADLDARVVGLRWRTYVAIAGVAGSAASVPDLLTFLL